VAGGRSGHPAEDEGLGRHNRALVIIAATIAAGGRRCDSRRDLIAIVSTAQEALKASWRGTWQTPALCSSRVQSS
jgi:hypothetical protein